jgi:hypothetical protein
MTKPDTATTTAVTTAAPAAPAEPAATGTRTEQAVTWVVGHAAELAGVTVPLVLAASVDGWFSVAAGAVATWWAAHEIHVHRARRAVTAKTPAGLLAGAPTTRTTNPSATNGSEESA